MQCEKIGDEALQGDKLDVLYGEADVAARERVQSHLELCPACRAELTALRGLRRDLAAWRLPEARQRRAPRGFVVPRWLAAAALFLLGFGATLGASGYLSLRRAVAEQQARADALEVLQRESQRSFQAALGQADGGASFLAQLDARIDERLRSKPDPGARELRAPARRLAGAGRRAAPGRHGAGRGQPELPRRPPWPAARAHERAARLLLQASDKR